MAVPESELIIIEESNCPLYDPGEKFFLSGNATLVPRENPSQFVVTTIIRVPDQKKICKILMGDITRALIKYERIDKIPPFFLTCSGCRGYLRIVHKKQNKRLARSNKEKPRRLLFDPLITTAPSA